ncbi:hypothetical protein [Streptomyces sp. NPDC048516]|uniref:hypothetical protein n=1 Tax=Streptomyces sp. NPDC048516 TaxID=3365565 RepID=UPI00371D6750
MSALEAALGGVHRVLGGTTALLATLPRRLATVLAALTLTATLLVLTLTAVLTVLALTTALVTLLASVAPGVLRLVLELVGLVLELVLDAHAVHS